MKSGSLAASLAATLLLCAAPAAKSPEQVWRETIAGENEIWSAKHHALLKIQDEAVLAEGASATLLGKAGQPASYHWASGVKPDGAAVTSIRDGKITAVVHGKTYDGAALAKGVAVDTNIEIVSQPVPGKPVSVYIFNQVRAEAVTFKGLDYFPYDPAYRVTANFAPDPKMPRRMFRLSRGEDYPFYHAGDATFVLNGKTLTLPLYAESNDPKKITDLDGYFTDGLTGSGTYGGGRYLNIGDFGSFPPKSVTIDFNLAYNPLCARSPYFSCPIATDAIATAVKAGEKDPHKPH
ncbi:MAG TPA: DUF1684 domain-containing protein [Rhizomicrobium sp.]|nr:DUF1684 domain-containing protein [Rhizomicrobium sp.]